MSNYSATIVRITDIKPHPNADKLNLTSIFGNTVIIGKDTQVGDLGVYFPVESQLSEEFAKANDLIRRKDENGKPAGGMLEENRRVRAIKLRGTPSMGLWLGIDCLGYLNRFDIPLEGTEFEEIDGKKICQKYIPVIHKMPGAPGSKKFKGQTARESKIIPGQFHFHFDTAQLGKNLHRIAPDDYVVLTWKLHGTSAIVGNVLVKRKLTLLERIARRLGVKVQESQYEYLYASRRVIKNEFEEYKEHFYSEDLWTRVGEENFKGKLYKGEQVYYEIVGYTKDGAYIQKDFDYRCAPGTNKALVYRITRTSPDGIVTELPWELVKKRCSEIGVHHVPEISTGSAFAFDSTGTDLEFLDFLKAQYVYDQDSQFCDNKVPEEGICIRKEGAEVEIFKLKSFRFLEYETKALDKGEVDLETEQNESNII